MTSAYTYIHFMPTVESSRDRGFGLPIYPVFFFAVRYLNINGGAIRLIGGHSPLVSKYFPSHLLLEPNLHYHFPIHLPQIPINKKNHVFAKYSHSLYFVADNFLDIIRVLADDGHVLGDNKLFLLSLGLNDADYSEISYGNRSLKSILTDGLLLWKSKTGRAATVDAVIDKLKRGNHIRAAGNTIRRGNHIRAAGNTIRRGNHIRNVGNIIRITSEWQVILLG